MDDIKRVAVDLSGRSAGLTRKWSSIIALALVFLFFFFTAREFSPSLSSTQSPTIAKTEQQVWDINVPSIDRSRRFVVLVPATDPSPSLCKFMLTAIALGYPSPIIINWGLDYHTVTKWDGGVNMPKITGISKYLDSALRDDAHPDEKLYEDDIVLIADGYDIWFQLPPDILLKRYHAINRRAKIRLLEEWPHASPMAMKQTIVASAQKRCWPAKEAPMDTHCEELPESPLSADIYGPETETNATSYEHWRPRFLNGGTYMGPAGDVRRMFRRALDKFENGIGQGYHLYSEQGITAEILGEQETWRNWQRRHNESGDAAETMIQDHFEFHIGLDYEQELSLPTCHSDFQGQIVAMNNRTAIDTFSAELGIIPTRVQEIPDDIKQGRNPLVDIMDPPLQWGDMPMYVDLFLKTIPVMQHHNAWKEGLKMRRVLWWDRTWFFAHLRPLLDFQLKPRPLVPLASVKTAGGGTEAGGTIKYWAPSSDSLRRKPRLFRETAAAMLPEVEFDTICRNPEGDKDEAIKWWDEVFRDGKGPLKN
ncbi:hypothetical protein G7Z17_g2556 [Cylindrodendrum hubeiense]|uniref:Uncharacterized protein n=1 Tax=Cylindrodendrum hubeiense TaxID=595255 RepID=A0A9P5HCK7_9HYPO|nr:hypothetical protein G7Z17_g2556 [Cylindrodendrum hubeiense]